MWPKRIENPVFLLNIYGHYPNLGDVEITDLHISWNGPSLILLAISTTLPYKPPAKWGKFNRVLFKLRFFAVISLDISEFRSSGASTLAIRDDRATIHAVVEGAVQLSLACESLFIDQISGLLVDSSV